MTKPTLVTTGTGDTATIQVNPPFVIWSQAGGENGPTLGYNAVGFDQNGVSGASVFVYDSANNAWRDTGQTVAGFFGVTA